MRNVEYKVERVIEDMDRYLLGCGYSWFEELFEFMVNDIGKRICGAFINNNAEIIMNTAMYRKFQSVAPLYKGPQWNGIRISEDFVSGPSYSFSTDERPRVKGIVKMVYREPVYIPFSSTERKNIMPPESVINGHELRELYFAIPKYLKIKKVIFNDPATIVFWNDGTKTVVKAQNYDEFDAEKGLAMAIVKKTIGLKEFYKAFDPAFIKTLENLEPESPLEKFNRAIKEIGRGVNE